MVNSVHFSRRHMLATVLGVFSTAWAFLTVQAQEVYPSERTIRIVTPYDPGSLVDVTTRLVADGLRTELASKASRSRPLKARTRMAPPHSGASTSLVCRSLALRIAAFESSFMETPEMKKPAFSGSLS